MVNGAHCGCGSPIRRYHKFAIMGRALLFDRIVRQGCGGNAISDSGTCAMWQALDIDVLVLLGGEVGRSKGVGMASHARSENKRRDRTQTPTNDPTNDNVQKCDGPGDGQIREDLHRVSGCFVCSSVYFGRWNVVECVHVHSACALCASHRESTTPPTGLALALTELTP